MPHITEPCSFSQTRDQFSWHSALRSGHLVFLFLRKQAAFPGFRRPSSTKVQHVHWRCGNIDGVDFGSSISCCAVYHYHFGNPMTSAIISLFFPNATHYFPRFYYVGISLHCWSRFYFTHHFPQPRHPQRIF